MLDYHNDGELQFAELVARLPCSLQLPRSWDEFLSVAGESAPVHPDTRRRYQRRHFRFKAGLLHRQTIPAVPREKRWHQVFVKDISRGGLAFYHSKQLFPRERMRLLLPDSTVERLMPDRVKCIIEVTRCRRIQDCCYEIGASFAEDFGDTVCAK